MKRPLPRGGVKQAPKKGKVDRALIAFSLKQYGGGTGGKAGDACLLQLADRALVVDFGISQQQQQLAADIKKLQSYDAVVTHFHEDHCGTPKQRRSAERLFLGPTSTMADHEHATDLPNAETPANDELIWDKTVGNLQARVWFIRGIGGDHDQEENAHSAGVYGEVERADEVVFRWASLGDMVPESWPNVDRVLPNGVMLNYLKLPHHASPSNHMPKLFKRHVDAKTTIVSSGFNNVSEAWRLITKANPLITREQLWILTYKEPGDLGIVWQDRVRAENNVHITGTR